MKIICLPIDDNRGLRSRVSPRFCNARNFLLVETGALAYRAIANTGGDAPCDPRVLLRGAPVDLFILGDGGSSDLPHLDAPVLRAPAGNVADALAAYIAGRLPLHA